MSALADLGRLLIRFADGGASERRERAAFDDGRKAERRVVEAGRLFDAIDRLREDEPVKVWEGQRVQTVSIAGGRAGVVDQIVDQLHQAADHLARVEGDRWRLDAITCHFDSDLATDWVTTLYLWRDDPDPEAA